MTATQTTPTPLTTTLAFLTIPILFHILTNTSRRRKTPSTTTTTTPTLHQSLNPQTTTVRPPFPPIIRSMLSSCRLAYLSTVDTSNTSSHLSLMRFTYINEEEEENGEIIVMSTRRNTKKFEMLQKQGGVALLIHDFPQSDGDAEGGGGEGVYSITLNGNCWIVEEGERAERYRAAHLEHNPDYPQFIVGEDIAMLCVDVSSARICNVNDEVTKWDVGDAVAGGGGGGD